LHRRVPEGHEKKERFRLDRTALLELEQAEMAGRIGEARTEMAVRIENLRGAGRRLAMFKTLRVLGQLAVVTYPFSQL